MKEYYNKWPGYHVYSHGSRQNTGTWAAIYDPKTKFSKQIHLPQISSIYTTEIYGIYLVTKYSSNLKANKILTDSQSVIQALQSNEKQLFKILPYVINSIYVYQILVRPGENNTYRICTVPLI